MKQATTTKPKPKNAPTTAATSAPSAGKLERNCLSPIGRVSYPNVFTAKSFQPGQEEKFSIVMLFDKTTDLKTPHKRPNGDIVLNLRQAAHHAAIEKWGPKEKWPKNLRMPFRDGDEDKPGVQGYENVIFVSASNKNRPGVVDAQRRPIVESDGSFYAGCYARVTLQAFAYDTMGNKGVSFSLLNIMKTGDGEPFSGRRSAEADFEGFGETTDESAEDPTAYGVDDDGSNDGDDEQDAGY